MMRLHKFLARAGIASRRRAEALIRNGRVQVNGKVVTELGTSVDPENDRISVDGELVGPPEVRTTIVLSKPMGVMTTMDDPEGRPTVASLVKGEPYRLVPIGRLDFNTEGVLLMTTDGELAHRLLHPRFKVPKIYTVKVAGTPSEHDLDRLRNGVELEDGMTQPALVEVIEDNVKDSWIEIILSEGRQRQVRRMCEAISHKALRVVRTAFATIDANDLAPGQYRYLSRSEIGGLYRLVDLGEPPPLSERAREFATRPLGIAERRKGPLPGEERGGKPRARRAPTPAEAARESKRKWVPKKERDAERRGSKRDEDRRGPFKPRRSEPFSPRSDFKSHAKRGRRTEADEVPLRDDEHETIEAVEPSEAPRGRSGFGGRARKTEAPRREDSTPRSSFRGPRSESGRGRPFTGRGGPRSESGRGRPFTDRGRPRTESDDRKPFTDRGAPRSETGRGRPFTGRGKPFTDRGGPRSESGDRRPFSGRGAPRSETERGRGFERDRGSGRARESARPRGRSFEPVRGRSFTSPGEGFRGPPREERGRSFEPRRSARTYGNASEGRGPSPRRGGGPRSSPRRGGPRGRGPTGRR